MFGLTRFHCIQSWKVNDVKSSLKSSDLNALNSSSIGRFEPAPIERVFVVYKLYKAPSVLFSHVINMGIFGGLKNWQNKAYTYINIFVIDANLIYLNILFMLICFSLPVTQLKSAQSKGIFWLRLRIKIILLTPTNNFKNRWAEYEKDSRSA